MKYIEEYELFENTLKKAKKDFLETDTFSMEWFSTMVGYDPTKNKKYVYWMCTHANGSEDFENYVHHLGDLVRWFHNNKNKIAVEMRDINKITPEDIEKMQQDPTYQSKKDKKLMLRSDKNYKIIYEDSKGNKLIEILNRFGCTYLTQLKTDKLHPATFCIGSFSNKRDYDYYMENKTKDNALYMLILPNEKFINRKIVLSPLEKDFGYYSYTNMENKTQELPEPFVTHDLHGGLKPRFDKSPNPLGPTSIISTINKYPKLKSHIKNIDKSIALYVEAFKEKKIIKDKFFKIYNYLIEKYKSELNKVWLQISPKYTEAELKRDNYFEQLNPYKHKYSFGWFLDDKDSNKISTHIDTKGNVYLGGRFEQANITKANKLIMKNFFKSSPENIVNTLSPYLTP